MHSSFFCVTKSRKLIRYELFEVYYSKNLKLIPVLVKTIIGTLSEHNSLDILQSEKGEILQRLSNTDLDCHSITFKLCF